MTQDPFIAGLMYELEKDATVRQKLMAGVLGTGLAVGSMATGASKAVGSVFKGHGFPRQSIERLVTTTKPTRKAWTTKPSGHTQKVESRLEIPTSAGKRRRKMFLGGDARYDVVKRLKPREGRSFPKAIARNPKDKTMQVGRSSTYSASGVAREKAQLNKMHDRLSKFDLVHPNPAAKIPKEF